LPLRRPAFLLLGFPGFFFTLLTTDYPATISIAFQYTTHWIPYMFAASVLFLMLLTRGRGGSSARRAALFALAFGVAFHSYVFGAILQRDTFVGGFSRIRFAMSDADRTEYADLERIIREIPIEASVAATDPESPHISTRLTAYSLDHHHGDADYLLVNKQHVGGIGQTNLGEAFDRSFYGLVDHIGDFYLFEKGHPNPQTDAAVGEIHLDPDAAGRRIRQ
jgi:uncharacterized membrane protein